MANQNDRPLAQRENVQNSDHLLFDEVVDAFAMQKPAIRTNFGPAARSILPDVELVQGVSADAVQRLEHDPDTVFDRNERIRSGQSSSGPAPFSEGHESVPDGSTIPRRPLAEPVAGTESSPFLTRLLAGFEHDPDTIIEWGLPVEPGTRGTTAGARSLVSRDDGARLPALERDPDTIIERVPSDVSSTTGRNDSSFGNQASRLLAERVEPAAEVEPAPNRSSVRSLLGQEVVLGGESNREVFVILHEVNGRYILDYRGDRAASRRNDFEYERLVLEPGVPSRQLTMIQNSNGETRFVDRSGGVWAYVLEGSGPYLVRDPFIEVVESHELRANGQLEVRRGVEATRPMAERVSSDATDVRRVNSREATAATRPLAERHLNQQTVRPAADVSSVERDPVRPAGRPGLRSGAALASARFDTGNDGTVHLEHERLAVISIEALRDQREVSAEQIEALEREARRYRTEGQTQRAEQIEHTARSLRGEFGEATRAEAHRNVLNSARHEAGQRSPRGGGLGAGVGLAILASAAMAYYIAEHSNNSGSLRRPMLGR